MNNIIFAQHTGLVLEGGGLRGVYTAGVLDTFLKHKIEFPYCIGVSAGAAYGSSFISKQYGRNIEINRRYTADPRYLSFRNLIRTGNIFDWEFVFREIPLSLIPFDFDTFYKSSTRFRIGITNCQTGVTEYRDALGLSREELLNSMAASSSIPFVSKVSELNGNFYMDGAIADPIPVRQTFADGNSRAVVILTRNKDYRKKPVKSEYFINRYYREYPQLANAIIQRPALYNQTLEELDELEEQGKIFIIRPQSPVKVSRVEKNPQKLEELYQTACSETEAIIDKLKTWLSHNV
ncbi:MAG: patatin family protein [Bacteroidota bacterium]|nr:patatin family protein [Bacteroidota bacterium]